MTKISIYKATNALILLHYNLVLSCLLKLLHKRQKKINFYKTIQLNYQQQKKKKWSLYKLLVKQKQSYG